MTHHPSAALQPGFIVNDLQISAILGVGAFGITYLATDATLGRSFALKEFFPAGDVNRREDGRVVPNDDLSEQQFVTGLQQFLDEARSIAALEHPAIVSVLRYFEANGTAYSQMAWSPGQSLHQTLKTGDTLDPDRARAMLLPIMDGLEYLHQQGLVHQDIKPANIYLTRNGDPILLDFGVAVGRRGSGAGELKLGSEGYAAVEQSAIDGRIGPWTDIYGLAATLYRSITGQIPPTATERHLALEAALPDPLTPFTELVPAGQFGGIRDAIELGMSVYPQDRPRDIGQWKKSFKSLDWHRSVVGGDSAVSYPTERRQWLPIVLLGVFLVAMVGVGVFLLTEEAPESETEQFQQPAVEQPSAENTGQRIRQPSAQESSRWQAALSADTTLAYRRFIEDYPQSIYVPQAEMQLDILDEKSWQELSLEDTVPAYEDYLELFPDGIHQGEAMVRIDEMIQQEARRERERLEHQRLENLAWETASKAGTIAAFDQYIADWPGGAHIEEANRMRRELKDRANDDKAFNIAQKLNTKDALQAYIDAFPTGTNVTAALQQIDELTLRPGKIFMECEACPAMTVVPAGAFWQGSDDDSILALSMEKPRRLVTIDEPFAVSVHEVSMAQWDTCFKDGACQTLPNDNGWGRADRPVMMVSWNDAQEYVHWISEKTGQSYRLPSESEWEYFARAGEESDWPGGDAGLLCTFANIAGTETGFRWQHQHCGDTLALGTAVAGSFKANAFGLYDVIGNVSEWTSDCMNLSYIDAPVDGSAWGRGICSSHMTRGGSWITGTKETRLPARFNLKNGDRNDFTGFRVVRTVEE